MMKTLFFFFLSFALTLAKVEDDFITGSRLFTADVYNQLRQDNQNILVSPFSAETILSLTQSGAEGATGEEIRSSLHLPNSKEETEEAMRRILPSVKSDYVTLTTANKIYVEEKYSIKEDFQRVARGVYQADFQNLEFGRVAEAAEEINEWVEEHTNGKIQKLINPDDLDDYTKILLVNALYFQGNWSVPFYPDLTKTATFYTSEESSIDTQMMYQESLECNYHNSEELDAQILEIPFQDDQARMVIALPNKKDGIAVLEKRIETVLEPVEFTKEFVEILLPKFRIESTIDVKKLLQKLGVQKAFTFGEADFSGISGEPGELFITQAKQKTYIDVNEIGVEAAAATEISGDDSLPPPASRFFKADHPFIFYLKIGDVVLFAGRVLVPEY